MTRPLPPPDSDLLAAARDASRPCAERLALVEQVRDANADAIALRGDLLRFLGRIDESEAVFHALRAASDKDGDHRTRALADIGCANARCARADWEAARRLLDTLVEANGVVLDPALKARIHAIRASTFFNENDLTSARHALEQALSVQRALRDMEGEAISTTSLGIVAFAEGATSRAFALLDEGRARARRVGSAHWEAMATSYLAMLRHDAGDLELARQLYDESIGALDTLGIRRAEGITLLGRAILRFEGRDLEQAEDDFRDALSAERATSPDYEPLLVAALALPAAVRRDLDACRHHIDFARECAVRRGSRFLPVIEAIAHDDVALLRSHGSIEGRLVARAITARRRLADTPILRIASDGAWFVVDAGDRVDIARRKPLRRILMALARQAGQGAPLGVDTLVRVGWPDERLIERTGATRLYTAIATLRKMGLEHAIERRGEGYALSAAFVVRFGD